MRLAGPCIVLLAVALVATGCAGAASGKKVIVLGIDGMDYGMLEAFIAEGRLPNFARLARDGDVSPLQTTMPPLSPVAWSTFITGMDPGGHGVFDFLLRDPHTMDVVEPFYIIGPEGRSLNLGSWVLPLTGGDIELYRRGQAWWELLEAAGIDTTIFRMPVNFPPVETGGRSFAGMGTPDIAGTHGTYSLLTDYPPDNMTAITGHVEIVEVVNGRVAAQLLGPPNALRRLPADGGFGGDETKYENPDLVADFEVMVDPDAAVVKIVVQDTELVLNEGEWSDWVPIEFELIPYVMSISALARFYLQEVRPDFKLYVTPLQIDPKDPANPLSNPEGWSADLYDVLGPFYTRRSCRKKRRPSRKASLTDASSGNSRSSSTVSVGVRWITSWTPSKQACCSSTSRASTKARTCSITTPTPSTRSTNLTCC